MYVEIAQGVSDLELVISEKIGDKTKMACVRVRTQRERELLLKHSSSSKVSKGVVSAAG